MQLYVTPQEMTAIQQYTKTFIKNNPQIFITDPIDLINPISQQLMTSQSNSSVIVDDLKNQSIAILKLLAKQQQITDDNHLTIIIKQLVTKTINKLS